ncbi:CheR family methyltransferase [Methanothermococcus okinawensis]|uniref:protein-glutamate O-methyltransferase n=1 Tax=Methanothermococcus okinawensis (strain DSM 14208 / JCM 11175 / IH1) TaxID=647113 RepID=F8AK19_METOI|nr:protein-glutamate O-methyltransferase CheR [Methanothermococcus okinawensis]AEH07380.1 MCP methyltransferase, CheR-type [Methanothermococcus okinawensis IH1]
MKTNDDIYFDKIKREIRFKLKINIEQYKDAYIKRRVAVRMRACKCKNYREYYEYLIKNNPDEYKKLEDTLTVNVTEFWRDNTVYKEIYKILENLIMDKRTIRGLKIWSAGCSSGEEPYGLAIMINELKEKHNRKFMPVSIIGTDLDSKILDRAKKGVYIHKQLKNIDKELISKYFIKLNEQEYELKKDIKKYVKFKKHDLIKEPPLKGMNIILCRNVIIYFDKKIQAELFLKFYEGLVNNGYLILGKTEILHGKARTLFTPINHRERIYMAKKN